jgi:hypothetical protein
VIGIQSIHSKGELFLQRPGERRRAVRDDATSLMRTENLTAEAMRQVAIPPTPLLKEISFAAIADGSEESSDEAEPDQPART